MKSLKFFRSVCRWANVLFSILRVFAVIGAVGVLIGIFSLSVLPKNFFTVDMTVQTDMKFNMSAILGADWEEDREALEEEAYALPEGAEWTEDGFAITETIPSTTMENRALALTLVPVFAQLLLSFALYLFVCRIFRALKDSPEPLTAPVSGNLKNAGWLLMAQGVVPALCGWLISLLTHTEGLVEVSFDLWQVFLGFLLWALADLIAHAASFVPAPSESAAPPFHGYSGYAPASEDQETVTPPAEDKKDDEGHHPDAF